MVTSSIELPLREEEGRAIEEPSLLHAKGGLPPLRRAVAGTRA